MLIIDFLNFCPLKTHSAKLSKFYVFQYLRFVEYYEISKNPVKCREKLLTSKIEKVEWYKRKKGFHVLNAGSIVGRIEYTFKLGIGIQWILKVEPVHTRILELVSHHVR